MTQHVRFPSAKPALRPAVAVAAVAAIAGVMFTSSAQLARGEAGLRQPAGLADMVRSETERVSELTELFEQLQSDIDSLTADVTGQAGPLEDKAAAQREAALVGTAPVRGPGIRVELDDAPASSANIPGATPDDLVVHQQDLQHVINALWAGGAEAMTLQGERVIMTSSFRCSGNILLLHGQVFSPPYVIEAIGDPARLLAALDGSPGVTTYRDYAALFGLGWSTTAIDEITMPAYGGSATLQFAALPEGVDPLR